MIEKDVEHPTHSVYYVVAGDEMQKLMQLKFPERKTIPFREDFSKGEGTDIKLAQQKQTCYEYKIQHTGSGGNAFDFFFGCALQFHRVFSFTCGH